MKHIFTISLCFLALSLSAQETITYPYNPDGDADGLVAVPDLQDLLAVYGSPFSPAEIMVGDTALSEWIQILYQALQDQQAVIESMQGADGCDFNYPHGLNGTPYSHSFSSQGDLIIPEGKVFYMNYEYGYEGMVTINGGVYEPNIDAASSIQQGDRGNPIIYPSGLILSDIDGSNINGLMIDDNTNIDVVFHSFANGDLVVPEGKLLYVTRTTTTLISNLNDVDYYFETLASSQPIALPSESIISPQTTNSSTNKFLFGYLVDEDYFADCGGSSVVGENTLIYDMQPEIDEFWQLYTYTSYPPYFPAITIPSGFDKVILTGSDSNYCNTNNCERVNVEISGGDMYDEITIIWETNNLRLMNFGVYQSGAINKGHIRVIKMMDGWTGEFRIQ